MSAEDSYGLARRVAREQQDYSALLNLVPYARYLGVSLQQNEGELRSHLPFRADLVGNRTINAFHGGVTAAFMENAAMLHLLLQLDESRVPKCIDFALDYLAPGLAHEMIAACSVTRLGIRIAQVQIRCWQQNPARPIAVGRAHFLLSKPE